MVQGRYHDILPNAKCDCQCSYRYHRRDGPIRLNSSLRKSARVVRVLAFTSDRNAVPHALQAKDRQAMLNLCRGTRLSLS